MLSLPIVICVAEYGALKVEQNSEIQSVSDL